MSTEVAYLSAGELTAHYAAGSLSPKAVTEAALAAIAAHDGALNAFRLVDAEAALASKSAVGPFGWYSGLDQGSVVDPRLADAARIEAGRSETIMGRRCTGRRALA